MNNAKEKSLTPTQSELSGETIKLLTDKGYTISKKEFIEHGDSWCIEAKKEKNPQSVFNNQLFSVQVFIGKRGKFEGTFWIYTFGHTQEIKLRKYRDLYFWMNSATTNI